MTKNAAASSLKSGCFLFFIATPHWPGCIFIPILRPIWDTDPREGGIVDKNYDPNSEYRRLPLLPLPATCPMCSAHLLKNGTVKRYDFKALGIGFLISLSLFILVLWVWPAWFNTFFVGWSPNWDDPIWLIFGAPFLLGIRFFWDYDKMVVMKCSACHWEKEFLDKNRKKRSFDSIDSRKKVKWNKESAIDETHPVYIIKDDNAGVAWEPDFNSHPTHCPECQKELMEPRARRPKWVPLMVAFYAFHTMVGLPFLLYLFENGYISILTGKARAVGFILLAALPALGAAYYRSAGRILPYECYSCGWKKSYPINETRKFDLPKEAYH